MPGVRERYHPPGWPPRKALFVDDRVHPQHCSRKFIFLRFAMADYLESNFETIGATLRKKASGIRQLAGKILEGEFRGRLYERGRH